MWLGEKHKEALATLKYGILDNKGFLLLTGDVGTGKTTLINALTKSLGDDIIHASVPDPSLERDDFFNYIGSAFDIGDTFSSKGTFLAKFRKFLHQAYDLNKKVLLIIDEAQLLTQELLEEIRLLSNIERSDAKLLNIFFIGQNEFNEVLNEDKNRAVRQRLTLHYIIEPLTVTEVDRYICHRLQVAGNSNKIFTSLAVKEIHSFSEGFPRRVNVICDHCLLTGYAVNIKIIDEMMVQECAKELQIPEKTLTRQEPPPLQPGIYAPTVPLPVIPPQPHYEKKGNGNLLVRSCLVVATFIVCLYYGDVFIQKLIDSTPTYTSIGREVPRETEQIRPAQSSALEQEIDIQALPPHSPPRIQPVHVEIEQTKKELLASALQVPGERVVNTYKEKIVAAETAIPPMSGEPLIIHFQFNSNEFEQGEREKMDTFVKALSLHPQTKLFLKGYSDAQGDKQYNLILSTFRANLVKSYLLGKGAKAQQIHVEGFGSKDPLESNETSWGRSMNRRVEIEIITSH